MRWLLLRGLVREARHWGDFPDRFAKALDTPRPLTLDLPGVGEASHVKPPLSVRAMTDDLRARFLAARAAGEPWGLLGVSLGGMVALDWMARFPEDFARGVVINTSAANASAPWERLRWRQYARVARCFFAEHEARERLVLAMTTKLEGARAQELAARHAAFARERPVSPAVAASQLFAASRSVLPAAVRVPALVIVADGDELVSPACSRRIAERLGLPLVVHPTGGHDLTTDDPDWVTSQVRAFVDRTRGDA